MKEAKVIERFQKAALHIIMGDKYESYSQALESSTQNLYQFHTELLDTGTLPYLT